MVHKLKLVLISSAIGIATVSDLAIAERGSSAATSPTVEIKDIVETAAGAGSFNTLITALKQAGLVDTFKGKGPFTVFAPTDEAFAKIPKEKLDEILADKAKLTRILNYHVVPGKVVASDVKPGLVKTAQGNSLTVSISGGNVVVDQAKVIKTDVMASNGVIHAIDNVMMPN